MRTNLSLALVVALATVLATPAGWAQQPPAAPAPAGKMPADRRQDAGAPSPAAPSPAARSGGHGGATSSGKRRPSKRSHRKAREPETKPVRPGAPIATYPGFRMLPDGGSRVFVEISKKVDITEHKAEGRFSYRLKGAIVPIRTNRLPIITSFFASPVNRAQLVEQGDNVDLVIETRQPTTPEHRVVQSEGGIVLQVDFPPLSGPVTVPASAAPRGKLRSSPNAQSAN